MIIASFTTQIRIPMATKSDPPKETGHKAQDYFEASMTVGKAGSFLAAIFASLATYLLSGGSVGASALVAFAVLAAVIAVCNKITLSTTAVLAHIDEISETVSGTKPVQ